MLLLPLAFVLCICAISATAIPTHAKTSLLTTGSAPELFLQKRDIAGESLLAEKGPIHSASESYRVPSSQTSRAEDQNHEHAKSQVNPVKLEKRGWDDLKPPPTPKSTSRNKHFGDGYEKYFSNSPSEVHKMFKQDTPTQKVPPSPAQEKYPQIDHSSRSRNQQQPYYSTINQYSGTGNPTGHKSPGGQSPKPLNPPDSPGFMKGNTHGNPNDEFFFGKSLAHYKNQKLPTIQEKPSPKAQPKANVQFNLGRQKSSSSEGSMEIKEPPRGGGGRMKDGNSFTVIRQNDHEHHANYLNHRSQHEKNQLEGQYCANCNDPAYATSGELHPLSCGHYSHARCHNQNSNVRPYPKSL